MVWVACGQRILAFNTDEAREIGQMSPDSLRVGSGHETSVNGAFSEDGHVRCVLHYACRRYIIKRVRNTEEQGEDEVRTKLISKINKVIRSDSVAVERSCTVYLPLAQSCSGSLRIRATLTSAECGLQ